jgi:transcriptional regulator with XRE-family HTH domain
MPGMFAFSPEELRRRRGAAGMSREELAFRVGRSFQSIGFYESGAVQPPVRILVRIAEVLGCEPGELFAEADLAVGQ